MNAKRNSVSVPAARSAQTIPSAARNGDLLTNEEAAAYLDTKPATLENWRCTRRYPLPYVRIGSNVRYRRKDLDEFLEKNTVRETASAP
jgi:excisionase family DNA binding protein